MGRAEKDQLENEDTLTMEHPLGLFKSKPTVVSKAGAFYLPGGEKQLCILPPCMHGKVQLGLRLFCWGSPLGFMTAQTHARAPLGLVRYFLLLQPWK